MSIFEATSDQARLVTTIIAAAIAVTVVILTQWLNSRRARKEKLIGKIEAIYSAVIKMQTLKLAIHAEIVANYPDKKKVASSYSDRLEKEKQIEWQRKLDGIRDEFLACGAEGYMLTGLYFPSLTKNIGDILSSFDGIYDSYIESETLSDYMVGTNVHHDNITILFLNTFGHLAEIMKKNMH